MAWNFHSVFKFGLTITFLGFIMAVLLWFCCISFDFISGCLEFQFGLLEFNLDYKDFFEFYLWIIFWKDDCLHLGLWCRKLPTIELGNFFLFCALVTYFNFFLWSVAQVTNHHRIWNLFFFFLCPLDLHCWLGLCFRQLITIELETFLASMPLWPCTIDRIFRLWLLDSEFLPFSRTWNESLLESVDC